MKHSLLAFVAFAFLTTCGAASAQVGTTTPVLSATPAPKPQQAEPSQAATSSDNRLASTDPDYKIGAEDGLQVTVWKEPTLSQQVSVRPDGMITMPLLGDVKAVGLTPTGLAADLTERLKKYINDPLVTVTVTQVNSKRIYFLGEVGHAGPMAMTPDMTPLQAIAAAGGLGQFADAKHIYILRTVNGKQQKIFFNYKKAIKTGDEQGITLLPGDTIVVP